MVEEADEGRLEKAGGGDLEITAEMFERQDYLVVLFEDEMDWNVACERFGIKTVRNATSSTKSSTLKQRGIGRVISAKTLLKELGYGV